MKEMRSSLGFRSAPMSCFLGIASLGLRHDQPGQAIMSKMIGKPIPGMETPAGSSSNPAFSSKALADGKVRLVNIFASWCVPCVAEVPQLAQLQQRGIVIEGIAIRDARPDVDRFLERHGNPYDRIGLDARSTAILSRLVRRTGELRVVDGKGVIRYQHWGPIMPQDMDTILGKLREAASEGRPVLLVAVALLRPCVGPRPALPPAPHANVQLDDPALEAQAKALMETIHAA